MYAVYGFLTSFVDLTWSVLSWQSKKCYEQKCQEADEAEIAADNRMATGNVKQQEKVWGTLLFPFCFIISSSKAHHTLPSIGFKSSAIVWPLVCNLPIICSVNYQCCSEYALVHTSSYYWEKSRGSRFQFLWFWPQCYDGHFLDQVLCATFGLVLDPWINNLGD